MYFIRHTSYVEGQLVRLVVKQCSLENNNQRYLEK